MFEIGQVFHVSHVVDDIDAAAAFYEDVFAGREWQRTELFGSTLSLQVVGDITLMPMAPAPAGSTGRFLERHGPHLHSLALYVEDPVDVIAHLKGQGLRLTGSSGQELDNPQDEIWTPPRGLPLLFELFEPRASMGDPRINEPDWSSAPWRDEHPMHIVGSSFAVVTADVATASSLLVDALRGKVVHESARTVYDTKSSFVALGRHVVIELAQPLDTESRAARDLAAGAPFHAVTFRVAHLGQALDHIGSKGIGIDRTADGHAELDPADTHGVLFRLTDRDITTW